MVSFRFGKCFGVFCIMLLMPALSLFAQQKNYSLPSLIDSVTHYLPLLKQKSRLTDAAKAHLTDTRHSFLPQLRVSEELSLGSDNSIPGSYFPMGITPSTAGGTRSDNNMQAASGNVGVLSAEYELANFGLNNAQLNLAQSYAQVAESDFQREQYLLELNVAKIYFNLQKSLYRLKADEQNVQRYQSIFNVIEALTLSGIKAGADSSLAKAELSKTKVSYNQTLGLINNQKQQLAYLTGIPAANLVFEVPEDAITNPKQLDTPLFPDAGSNPLIEYYIKRNNIYTANEQLIKKSYLPKILLEGSTWMRGSSITYNDQYQGLANGLGYQRYNYMFGVAATYSLFNELHKKDKLAINRFEMQASNYELEQQKLAIASASLQADNALQTTAANLKEIPVQLQAAQAMYKQKLSQYKAGLISLIDLTNASFVLYRSQTDYIETMNDAYLAQLDKAAANGSLNQYISTVQ
jgi:outer membrane protein TolC